MNRHAVVCRYYLTVVDVASQPAIGVTNVVRHSAERVKIRIGAVVFANQSRMLQPACTVELAMSLAVHVRHVLNANQANQVRNCFVPHGVPGRALSGLLCPFPLITEHFRLRLLTFSCSCGPIVSRRRRN